MVKRTIFGPANSKTGTGFENCPRFVGVIEQNKIQQTFPHDCISTALIYSKYTKFLEEMKVVESCMV